MKRKMLKETEREWEREKIILQLKGTDFEAVFDDYIESLLCKYA